jgi:copper chaperone
MAKLFLHIENMHCGACVRRVTMALNTLPDTHADQVGVGTASITTTATPELIQQTLAATGYPATITTTAP